MTNSKRECKNCGHYYKWKPEYPNFRKWCSKKCHIELGLKELVKIKEKARLRIIKKRRKEVKKETKSLKARWGLDKKLREHGARMTCHTYIRARDKENKCICCDKELGDKSQAGHYLESGNYPFIRYHEDNIHGQRLDCNMYKGGDSGMYRVNLIKKIGLKRVEWLEANKSKSIKRNSDDYRKIEVYFKKLIEEA